MQRSQLQKRALQFDWGAVAHQLADQSVRMSIDFDMGKDGAISAMPMRFRLDFLDLHHGNLTQGLPQSFYCFIL